MTLQFTPSARAQFLAVIITSVAMTQERQDSFANAPSRFSVGSDNFQARVEPFPSFQNYPTGKSLLLRIVFSIVQDRTQSGSGAYGMVPSYRMNP